MACVMDYTAGMQRMLTEGFGYKKTKSQKATLALDIKYYTDNVSMDFMGWHRARKEKIDKYSMLNTIKVSQKTIDFGHRNANGVKTENVPEQDNDD